MNKEQKIEKVDETIEAICDWIQTEVKRTSGPQKSDILPEMVKALAELVSAREQRATLFL